jgi:NADH-quinone oxidoreductase subunit H
LPEAESELVAGFMTEYSAFIFVAFFLFEYTGIVILSTLTAILFFGGYNTPEFFYTLMDFNYIPFIYFSYTSIFLGLKVSLLVFCVI